MNGARLGCLHTSHRISVFSGRLMKLGKHGIFSGLDPSLKQRDKGLSLHPIHLGQAHDFENGRHEVYGGYEILVVKGMSRAILKSSPPTIV